MRTAHSMHLSLYKLRERLFPLSGQKRKKTLCQGCDSTAAGGLPLTVQGFFVLNSEKGKSHMPAGGGAEIFCFFLVFFSIFSSFFRLSLLFPDFFRLSLLFAAFSAFAPLWGVRGSAKQASVSPSVIYSVYMYRVKMSILKGQNVHSEVSKCPFRMDKNVHSRLTHISFFSLICSPKERKKKRLQARRA